MKRYIPFKYVLGMIGLFILIPSIGIFLLLQVIGIYDITIGMSLFLAGMIVFLGPAAFVANKENASVVFTGESVTNHMSDGTSNHGWTEELKNITKVELVGTDEIRKTHKNGKAKKAILIHFGEYNIRYIAVTLFTQKQITQKLNKLRKANDQPVK